MVALRLRKEDRIKKEAAESELNRNFYYHSVRLLTSKLV